MNGVRAFFRHLGYSRWPVLTAAAASVAAFASLWFTEREARHAPLERAGVVDVAISSDGKFIATATDDGVLEVRLASAGLESQWRVQRVHRSAQTLLFDQYTPVSEASDAETVDSEPVPEETRLIIASVDGKIAVHDASTGRKVFSVDGLPDSFFAPVIAVGPDNTLWASGMSPELGYWIGYVDAEGSVFYEPLVGENEERVLEAGNAPVDLIVPIAGDSANTFHQNGAMTEWQFDRGATSQLGGESRRVEEPQFRVASEFSGALGHAPEAYSMAMNKAGTMLAIGDRWEMMPFYRDAPVPLPAVVTLRTGSSGILEGHTDEINTASYSADGSRIVSASHDNTARVWQQDDDGTWQSQVLRGHTETVWSAALSPDGRRIVTASADSTLRVWTEDDDGNWQGQTLRGHTDQVTSAAFSPDGERIVSASFDNSARIWRKTGNDTWESDIVGEHTRWLWTAVFSPDGRRVLTGSSDYIARIWSPAEDGSWQLESLEGHERVVNSARFSPDGQSVVTTSDDGSVRVWGRNEEGAWQGRILEGHTTWVRSAEWSPDGTRIVSGSGDDTVRVWEQTEDGNWQSQPLSDHSSAVMSTNFSPDGSRIISASRDRTVRIWRETPSGTWVLDTAPPCSLEPMAASLMINSSGAPSHFWITETTRLCGLAIEPDVGDLIEDPDYQDYLQTESEANELLGELEFEVTDEFNSGLGPRAVEIAQELFQLLEITDVELLAPLTQSEGAAWINTTLRPAVDARLSEIRADVVGDPEILAALENFEESIFHELRAEMTAAAYLTMDRQESESAPRALVGYGDGTVDLISLESGNTLATYRGHGGAITHIKVAGRRAVIGARDGSVQVIDLPVDGAPSLARAAHVTGSALASGRAMHLSMLDAIAPKVEREEEAASELLPITPGPISNDSSSLDDLRSLFPGSPEVIDALSFTWQWEGASAENNWGVTQSQYDVWRDAQFLESSDISNITLADAASVYHLIYWQRIQADEFDEPLNLVMFDTAVNQGTQAALFRLSDALIELSEQERRTGDGQRYQSFLASAQNIQEAGRRTNDIDESSVNFVRSLNQQDLVDAYLDRREAVHRELASRNENQRQFLDGWLNRVNALRAEAGVEIPVRSESETPEDPGEQTVDDGLPEGEDEVGDAFTNAPIAFEAPQSVRVGESFAVTVGLDANSLLEGESVSMFLESEGIEFTSVTPERQVLSTGENIWRWSGVASTAGDSKGLVLSSVLQRPGREALYQTQTIASVNVAPSADQPEQDVIEQDTSSNPEPIVARGVVVRGVCPPERAQSFVVYFEWDGYSLTEQAAAVLDQAVANLDGCTPRSTTIVGHDDTSQNEKISQANSARRASAVRDALVSRGIDASIISMDARGETELAKATRDGVREPLNRRVEVTIQ